MGFTVRTDDSGAHAHASVGMPPGFRWTHQLTCHGALVVASVQQVLLIKNIEASLAKYAYGLLDIVGKDGNGWATSRSAQKRVRVVNTDFTAEKRRPRMKKRPFPRWQIYDEKFRLTDLETCAAHQIIGPVRVVEDHAADCAVERVDDRYSEDANLGLIEQPGEAQKLPYPVLNEHGLLPDRWHAMRLGCLKRFNIHNQPVYRPTPDDQAFFRVFRCIIEVGQVPIPQSHLLSPWQSSRFKRNRISLTIVCQ